MLETTRNATFVPGSNLLTPGAGGGWLFLLPRLSLGRIMVIGTVSGSTLAALCRVGRQVTLVCSGRAQLHRANAFVRRRGFSNARAVSERDRKRLPDGGADLVVVASARRARRLQRGDRWPEVARLLRSDGVVYVESRARRERVESSIGGGGWLVSAGRERFAIAPAAGEVRAAVPAGDQETIRELERRGLWSAGALLGIRGRIREIPIGRMNRILRPRSAVLAGLGVSGWLGRAPLYLREIAREAGIDIDSHRWGMAAPGFYLSNKVLFLLFEKSSGRLDYVVKVTRDPALNPRLANEWRALGELQTRGFGDDGAVPRPAFFGTSGSLAVLGQTGVEGRPFVEESPATPESSFARSATEWLTDLGAATADVDSGGAVNAAGHLRDLLERFAGVYTLDPRHRESLESQIETIAHFSGPFPSVFQHGDPGAWNLLVTASGGVAVLDWEAAETRGMPLWDLFHFMRSFGVLTARAAGQNDRLRGFAEQFLEEGPMSSLLAGVTARYCGRVGVDQKLVAPIFYMGWMHRALKEATRLPPERLDRGHYLNLLRMCLDAEQRPALRSLFTLDVASTRL